MRPVFLICFMAILPSFASAQTSYLDAAPTLTTFLVGTCAILAGLGSGMILIIRMRFSMRQRIRGAEIDSRMMRAEMANLHRSNSELAQKNKHLEDMIYEVNHDLSRPMVSISGFARSAIHAQSKGDTDQVPQYLERVEANVGNMSTLIDGVLDRSRINQRAPSLSEFSLSELVTSLETRFHGALGAIDANFDCEQDDLIRTDRQLLERALQNIVENAVKHGCPSSGRNIRISAQVNPVGVRLNICDPGEGSANSRARQLIDRHNSRNHQSNTGQGLTIAKRLVDQLGGEIGVESPVGVGRTVWIDLPQSTGMNRRAG